MPSEPPSSLADVAERWNGRYAGTDFLFGTAPNAWLRAHAGVWSPGARVLCVADGEGRNGVWLAQQGLYVTAFDIADKAVAKARAMAERHEVVERFQVRIADVDGFDWPIDALDGVAAIFVQFADPPLRKRMFARITAALKPGGTLVLQGYTLEQVGRGTGGPPQASHMYTEAMLRDAFADLEIVEMRAYEDDVDEGLGHKGRSALIGLVARRRPAT
jgi:SAM-dependent methyltransferase